MKDFIKNWLFGDELKKMKELEEENAKLEEAKTELEEENAKLKTPPKTEKELATEQGKPFVDIVRVEYDPKRPGDGSFELDWNVYFVSLLRTNGFVGDSDEAIIDQWFSQVCKNISLEVFEQMMADPEKRASMIERKDLGGGKTEYS